TLTRIRLNRRSQAVRRDLTDPASLHKRIMLLAPDNLGDHARKQAGLLFRLEDATLHTPPTLFIQSHQSPDLTRLPPAYGTAETRDLTPMLEALTPGRHVRYRITANPSRRRHITTGDPFFGDLTTRHHDEPLNGPDALAWWQRKATH
ncbi:type I-E CRISPR-associated protein Cas6/Cse3/CasE, partial [Streptomyces sp. CWNU-52H]|uniref:type I-E CRISPR-associated protein Cas6/Cse3/CasE n=1 Tax=Streptomyces sp. CWNU-52H TaxID=3394352 RepID=UPI0039BF3421